MIDVRREKTKSFLNNFISHSNVKELKKSYRTQHQIFFQFFISQLNIIFVGREIDRYYLSQFLILMGEKKIKTFFQHRHQKPSLA